MTRDAYKDAGVDIEAGQAVVSRIGEAVARTVRPEVMGGLGGFAALFRLGDRWRDPVLVSGTDGVGTKLLVAGRMGRHETIGIDLVAMCVNDVACSGAEPLFFLDYFATGRLEPDRAVEVIRGIAAGCEQAGCALVGGETAEMPGMYAPGDYDLAGFCVGAVEREELVDGRRIRAGDAIVGLPSTGLHSNGYSLARKLCEGLDWDAEHGLGRPLGEVLLEPTAIYVRQLQALRGLDVRGIVHITGGGFFGNIPRVLPRGLAGMLWRGCWEVPPIFDLLRRLGHLSDADMFRTFNNGLGMVVIVPPDQADEAARRAGGRLVGEVVEDAERGVVIR